MSNTIDEKEFEVAMEEAKTSEDAVTIKLIEPVTYNGKNYESLSFNFKKLKGSDALAIESELERIGKATMVPAFSGEYIIRMLARACTEVVGDDLFRALSLNDYEKVKSQARNFLLKRG